MSLPAPRKLPKHTDLKSGRSCPLPSGLLFYYEPLDDVGGAFGTVAQLPAAKLGEFTGSKRRS